MRISMAISKVCDFLRLLFDKREKNANVDEDDISKMWINLSHRRHDRDFDDLLIFYTLARSTNI